MKSYRKILSLLLAAFMLLAALPGELLGIRAEAAPPYDTAAPAGTGISDWASITNTAGNYYLKNDIDLTQLSPINEFTGTLDGNGYTITVKGIQVLDKCWVANDNDANNNYMKNYMYQAPSILYSGLLFNTLGGTVKNLNVVISDVTYYHRSFSTEDAVGGIAGQLTSKGRIQNCGVSGTLKADVKLPFVAGGVFVFPGTDVGRRNHEFMKNNTSVIIDLGGLVGRIQGGTVDGCFSSVKLSVGGVEPDLFSASNFGGSEYSVIWSNQLRVGSLAGVLQQGSVTNCLVDGSNLYDGVEDGLKRNKNTTLYFGGLVGILANGGTVQYNIRRNSSITANVNSSNKSFSNYLVGYLWTNNLTSCVLNNYNDDNQNIEPYTGYNRYAVGYFDSSNNATGSHLDDAAYGNSLVKYGSIGQPTLAALGCKGNDGDAWVDDIYYETPPTRTTSGPIQEIDLMWRTTPAPTVTPGDNFGQAGSVINFQAPKSPPPYYQPTTQIDANKINYTVEYATQGQIEAPEVDKITINSDGNIAVANIVTGSTISITYSSAQVITLPGTFPKEITADTGIIDLGLVESRYKYPVDSVFPTNKVDYFDAESSTAKPVTKTEIYTLTFYLKRIPDDSSTLAASGATEVVVTVTASRTKKWDDAAGAAITVDGEDIITAEIASSVQGTPAAETGGTPYTINGTCGQNATGAGSVTLADAPIKQNSSVNVTTWVSGVPRPRRNTYPITVGDGTATPLITPPGDGQTSLGLGITIYTEANSTVYYTITAAGTPTEKPVSPPTPPPSSQKSITDTGSGKVVIDWSAINTTFGANTEITVRAIAVGKKGATDKTPSTEATPVTYRVGNKPRDPAPVLTITQSGASSAFNSSRYYSGGSVIGFETPSYIKGEKYTIRFTTDGAVPTSYSGTEYKSDAATLPANVSEVRIKAVVLRDNYPDSIVGEYLVRIKTRHKAPAYSIWENSRIASGQLLYLMLNPSDYPAMIRPTYYMKEGDSSTYQFEDIQNNPGEYYGVLEVRDNSSFNYSAYSGNLPGIKYKRTVVSGSTTTDFSELSYSLGSPEIRFFTDGVENVSSRIVHKKGSAIELKGNPGDMVTINTRLVANNTNAYEDSATYAATNTYTIFTAVATPTASPSTKADSATVLSAGTNIMLSTSTVGAKIYYSRTGIPTVAADNVTVTGGTLYDPSKGIPIEGGAGTFFTVHAIAVKSGMQPSEGIMFTYQLPAPVQAVLATPLEGTVIKGTEVKLSTTTAGAVIFYEIAYGNKTPDDPVPNESAVYDPAKPFKIEQKTTISAVAVKDKVESVVNEYTYTVAGQLKAPEPSIPGGSVVAKGTKVTLKSDEGASIVYTKDGSDPLDESNKNRMFGSEIVIDAEEGKSVNITACATQTGKTPSEVVSLSYTISKAGEVLWANPPAGTTVMPGDKILLSTSVSGGVIHYTADGAEPSASSPQGGTVTVEGNHGENFVLRAAVVSNGVITGTQIFNYGIIAQTPAPSANIPSNAVFVEGAAVVLSATEGKIFYTTDGTAPTSSSHMYTEPIVLTDSMVLKAIAIADGKAPSRIAEYIYTRAGQAAAPSASRQSGSIEINSRIELSTATEGAAIYYTTDGSEPTRGNLKNCFAYDGPITISRPVTIKMFAIKNGLADSLVNMVAYTVAEPPPEDEAEGAQAAQKDTGKLFLFDQYVGAGEGPQFSDVVLRDQQTMTVVSAKADALPGDASLVVVRKKSPTSEEAEAVRRATELQIAALYDITIVRNGEPVQPSAPDGVEVGIPIPEGFDDGVVMIVRLNDNGTVTTFPTRRANNVAYAVVDHFSRYAVVVPQFDNASGAGWWLRVLAYATAALLLVGAVVLIVFIAKKKKNTGRS